MTALSFPQCHRCGNVAVPNHVCLRPPRDNTSCARPACRSYGSMQCLFPGKCET